MNIKDLALNKTIHWKDKDWTIIEVVDIGPDDYGFRLQPVKGRKDTSNLIGPRAIANGIATTDSQELNDICKELTSKADKDKADKEQAAIARREQDKKDYEAKKAEADALRKETTIKDAKMHVADNNRKVYNMFKNPLKYLNSPTYQYLIAKYDRDLYIVTFEEAEQEKRKNKLLANRYRKGLLDDYPGDKDELIDWIKTHAKSITIQTSNAEAAATEQTALDIINNELGTDYKVEVLDSKGSNIYISYILTFKDPDSAPKEFKSWSVPKQSKDTTDTQHKVLIPALDKQGRLTSTDIVRELIFDPSIRLAVKKESIPSKMTVTEALKYLKKQK